MNNHLIKTPLITAALLLMGAGSARAHFTDTLAANFRVPDKVDYTVRTKAPAGYKCVYISHYARHGARYMGNEAEYLQVLGPLGTADSTGNLTAAGTAFYKAAREFYINDVKGRTGELTSIGWNQHREIAEQIYRNYPEYFRHHPKVTATATHFQRAITSMTSFCISLQKCDSKIDIYAESNGRNYPKLLNEKGDCGFTPPEWRPIKDTWYMDIDCDAVLSRIFKDPSAIKNRHNLVKDIYEFIIAAPCVENAPDFSAFGLLTEEEMQMCYRGQAQQLYRRCCIPRRRAIPVLQGIFEDAQEDLSSGECRMRARFGHEIVIAYMLSLLNADHFGEKAEDERDAYKTMRTFRIPMGATLLFVFYQNGEHTLVKILLNGEEVFLPIPSVSGPYYDWYCLQRYFIQRV